MNQKLTEMKNLQVSESQQVLSGLTEKLKLENVVNLNIFMSSQQAVIEEFTRGLEKQLSVLELELERSVVELTAKITMTKNLLFEAGRQLERRDALREEIIEK